MNLTRQLRIESPKEYFDHKELQEMLNLSNKYDKNTKRIIELTIEEWEQSPFTKQLYFLLKENNLHDPIHEELSLMMDRSKMSLKKLLKQPNVKYPITEIEINPITDKIKRIVYLGKEYK